MTQRRQTNGVSKRRRSLCQRRREPPPMTLGGVLRTNMQLIAWCHACLYQVEPDVAAQVERYGPDLEVPERVTRASILGGIRAQDQ